MAPAPDYDVLEFEIFADDGGVLYLDGEVLAEINFSGEDRYNALAKGFVDEDAPPIKIFLNRRLEEGEHTVAFSLHNYSSTSSDLEFFLKLNGLNESPDPPAELSSTVEGGQVTITGSNKSVTGKLVIPETIRGLPVRKIGVGAFRDCRWYEIVIPEGVITIEDMAFRDGKLLSEVTIPKSVTMIGESAFSGCGSLTSITIPDGIIGLKTSLFSGCSNLTSVVLPKSLLSIGRSTFEYCTSLRNITIPESMIFIQNDAFESCSELQSVVIPGGVKNIGFGVFYLCSNLKDVEIAEGVMTIGGNAFGRCINLKALTIPASVTGIHDSAFAGSGALTTIRFLGPPPNIGDEPVFRNINPRAMAVVEPAHLAAFGGEGADWNGLTVRLIPPVGAPILTHGVSVNDEFLTIRFSGEFGVMDWKITGSPDLMNYADDLTAETVITETGVGEYEAVVDTADKPERYFIRVER